MKFRKIVPDEIDAFQWKGDDTQGLGEEWAQSANGAGVIVFMGKGTPKCTMHVRLGSTLVPVKHGDWVLQRSDGALALFPDKVFREVYDVPAEEPAAEAEPEKEPEISGSDAETQPAAESSETITEGGEQTDGSNEETSGEEAREESASQEGSAEEEAVTQ